jgi:hypothetical protein
VSRGPVQPPWRRYVTDCIEEARLYRYKVDKLTGDVKPEVEDKHNHCIDAMKCALAPFIKLKRTGPTVGGTTIG